MFTNYQARLLIEKELQEKIGKFWDRSNKFDWQNKAIKFFKEFIKEKKLPVKGYITSVFRSAGGKKVGWWNNTFVIKKINEIICGYPLEGRNQGLICELKKIYADSIPFNRCVSIGCGNGSNELALIKQGIANHFDLFELSIEKITEGLRLAGENGLSAHVNYLHGNAFELIDEVNKYDLVVWCDALHHMPDVDYAVSWSRNVLRQGGIFYMSDYVGPSRFQWSEKSIRIAQSVIASIDPKYLVSPNRPFARPCFSVVRPKIEDVIACDPSEAWDSEGILPSVKKYFPEIKIYETGGVVYFLALNKCIHNFHPIKDRNILELLLLCDKLCVEKGEPTLYAAALGRKNI